MDLGIAGRRAAVAGASAGLGFATAAALVAEGVKVAICGRDKERIEKAAAQLGSNAVPLVADVSSADGGIEFVRAAREALGGLDILVPNTGGPPPGNFATTSVEAYRDAIDLNLLSTIGMCREAVPAMQEQKWGRVVAITSIGVRQPIGALAASVTARTGVTGFLKVMATEVAPDGVTVNSLQPGLHATDRVEKLSGGNTEALAASVPVGFLGSAEDFGQIAAFLCSEHARFLTGCGIHVDGGAYTALL